MGTSGLFGFCYKNKYYLVYNHLDSYPVYLGNNLVAEIVLAIQNNTFDQWLHELSALKIIDELNPPAQTLEDIAKLARYANTTVSSQSFFDWYCLLRRCQGSYRAVLESGYLLQNTDKPGCDLIEYCYVVNFDNQTFDYYLRNNTLISIALKDLTSDYFTKKI